MNVLLPLGGGLLIGAAAIVMLLGIGRIAGISGICWSALANRPVEAWRWLFLAGMVLGGIAYHALTGAPAPAPSEASLPLTLSAGLLVGFGVYVGSGCTSGHGVCGLGRFSLRSLAATLTFMACGIATVFIARQFAGVA